MLVFCEIDNKYSKNIIAELAIKDNIIDNLKLLLTSDVLPELTKFEIDDNEDGCNYEHLETLEHIIGNDKSEIIEIITFV